MNTKAAVAQIRKFDTAHTHTEFLPKAVRSALNPALSAVKLPTFSGATTLAEYGARLTAAEVEILRSVLGAPKPAKAPKGKTWTCACTTVREHIVASKDGHAAQTAALFAQAV